MNLYLIRHAEAADLEPGDEHDDSERPLTGAGKAQCAALASRVQARSVILNQVVTSPLLRAGAADGGSVVGALADAAPRAELTCNALAPGGRAKKITRFLLGLNGENVGLVGHMPDLAEYAGWLIGTKKTRLEMAKAGAAFIRFDGSPDKGEGSLVWLATPEWFEGGKWARTSEGRSATSSAAAFAVRRGGRSSAAPGAAGFAPRTGPQGRSSGRNDCRTSPRSSGDSLWTDRCSSAGSDITTSRRNSGGSGWRSAQRRSGDRRLQRRPLLLRGQLPEMIPKEKVIELLRR